VRARRAPQDGQYIAPANINAKHAGQLIVASVAWQYLQDASSGAAGAPQFGQCNDPASPLCMAQCSVQGFNGFNGFNGFRFWVPVAGSNPNL